MSEKENPTVVHTGNGAAGWFVAILILLVVAFGGWYLLSDSGLNAGDEVELEVSVPETPETQPAEE